MKDYRFTIEVRGLDDDEGEVDAVVSVLADVLSYVEHLELEDSSIVRAVGDMMESALPEDISKSLCHEVFFALDRFAEIEVTHFDYATLPFESFTPDMDDFREFEVVKANAEAAAAAEESEEDLAEGEEPDDD
jgi:hypothetical protein